MVASAPCLNSVVHGLVLWCMPARLARAALRWIGQRQLVLLLVLLLLSPRSCARNARRR